MTERQAPPLESNLIEKADAGAQLFFALYHLRGEKAIELFRGCSPGLTRAWLRAQAAFIEPARAEEEP